MNTLDFTLGDLSNPLNCHHPIDFDPPDHCRVIRFYREMNIIRLVERQLACMRRDGYIGGPVHLGVGQEAVAVGVSSNLRCTDRVFGAHRSHSHILALGSSIHGLFAEVLGKDTGYSKGMGGSMHLWDQPKGFYGSVPIVAGTVSLAVGAGLAAQLDQTDDVAVAYFGDGAIEEGVVHESLNFARCHNIPVIFVMENNLFASHMHISLRQPKDSTARFATANDIPFRIVDGNDVLAVADAGRALIEQARAGKGPGFIEAVTFRWYGHVDWREDIDVGVHRSVDELDNWRARDPIRRLKTAMVEAGVWSEEADQTMLAALQAEVSDAWEQATQDPYPPESALLGRVYANGGRL